MLVRLSMCISIHLFIPVPCIQCAHKALHTNGSYYVHEVHLYDVFVRDSTFIDGPFLVMVVRNILVIGRRVCGGGRTAVGTNGTAIGQTCTIIKFIFNI